MQGHRVKALLAVRGNARIFRTSCQSKCSFRFISITFHPLRIATSTRGGIWLIRQVVTSVRWRRENLSLFFHIAVALLE